MDKEGGREGYMYGVTFEGDNLRIVLVRQEKRRRMLPFAFQVTDVHAQYNYHHHHHHHPSNRRNNSGK